MVQFKDVRVILLRMTKPSDFTTTERHAVPAVMIGDRVYIGQTDVTRRVREVFPR